MILRNKNRQRLIDIFSEVGVRFEVWAYGSRVNGNAHEGSDLDLVIRGQDLQRIPAKIIYDLKERIKHSNIPILVELRDWHDLPEHFHRAILSNYEVLFSNLQNVKEEILTS